MVGDGGRFDSETDLAVSRLSVGRGPDLADQFSRFSVHQAVLKTVRVQVHVAARSRPHDQRAFDACPHAGLGEQVEPAALQRLEVGPHERVRPAHGRAQPVRVVSGRVVLCSPSRSVSTTVADTNIEIIHVKRFSKIIFDHNIGERTL